MILFKVSVVCGTFMLKRILRIGFLFRVSVVWGTFVKKLMTVLATLRNDLFICEIALKVKDVVTNLPNEAILTVIVLNEMVWMMFL